MQPKNPSTIVTLTRNHHRYETVATHLPGPFANMPQPTDVATYAKIHASTHKSHSPSLTATVLQPSERENCEEKKMRENLDS